MQDSVSLKLPQPAGDAAARQWGSSPSVTAAYFKNGWDDVSSAQSSRSPALRKKALTRSAPLIPAQASTNASAWFTTSYAGSDRTTKRAMWRPLGSTWRERESDPLATGTLGRQSQLRSNADEGHSFVHGSVPHWGRDTNLRAKGVLAHQLTWAYYRMRRHKEHPLRKEVGDPRLPQTDVCAEMRSGVGSMFEFWRDLRPPFEVHRVEAADDWHPGHPDGRLYSVTYMCGIEYCSERLWNLKSDGGTFDNKVSAVAQVRIPDKFDSKRPMQIVSWGRPSLNKVPDTEGAGEGGIPPEEWSPIAEFLGKRPDDPQFEACREAIRRATPKKGTQVPPMQRLLLGQHAGMTKFADVERSRDPKLSEQQLRGVTLDGKPARRQHRIFTAAAGFVDYSG